MMIILISPNCQVYKGVFLKRLEFNQINQKTDLWIFFIAYHKLFQAHLKTKE
jgi:hypothetical protein